MLEARALDRRRAQSRPPVREIAGCGSVRFAARYRDGRYIALTQEAFAVLEVLIAPKAVSSAPKSSANEHGTRTLTRSPTPFASRSRPCANDSANHGHTTVAGVGYRIDTGPDPGSVEGERG